MSRGLRTPIVPLLIAIYLIIGHSCSDPIEDQSLSGNHTSSGKVDSIQKSSSNTTTNVPKQDDNSTDKKAQESISSSVVSSFYNLFNNATDHLETGDEPKVQNTNHQKKKSSRQLGNHLSLQDLQQQMMQQSYIPHAIAYTNGNPSHLTGLTNTVYPNSLAVANANQNFFVQPSNVYDQPLALQPSQEHVVAQLIVDPISNQQMVDMQPNFAPNTQRVRHQYVSNDMYGAQQNNYNDQVNMYHPHQGLHRIISADQAQQQQQESEPSRHSGSQDNPDSEESKQDKGKLSNEQLMTLIDELKEFNNKQASKILARGILASDKKERPMKQIRELEKEIDAPDEEPEEVQKEYETTQPVRYKSDTETIDKTPELNQEELKKFARFLLSKEGSNMKFQLGLEKDSPDDGDEADERDSLLETNPKQTKTPLKKKKRKKQLPKELDDLDRKHRRVSSSMDKIIEEMTGFVQKVGPKRKHKRPKEDENDDSNLARARRNSKRSQQRDDEPSRENDLGHSRKETMDNRDIGKNFAKMLINQELQQDKFESDKPDTSNDPNESSDNSVKDVVFDKANSMDLPRKIRRSTDDDNNSPEIAQSKGGSEDQRYHRKERNRDHIALIHEMQAARKAKKNLRSRIPIAADPLVRKALDSELGLRGETQSNGDLVIKSNKDDSIAMRVPKQQLDQDEKKYRDDLESESEGPTKTDKGNGENLKTISVQSGSPIKDEYPVSERVGERLNKLSRNLDRYFNDGFIQEIESKAGLPASIADQQPIRDEPGGESSNQVTDKVADTSQSRKINGVQVDNDFDVDVGIDGKRDVSKGDDDEDDDDSSDSDERDSKNKPIRKFRRSQKDEQKPNARPVSGSDRGRQRRVIAGRANHDIEPSEGESRQGSSSTDLSAGKDNLEFDNQSGSTPNLDPVDNETMDTPIGPDGGNNESHLQAVANKMQSSRISDKTSKSYGKGMKSKFYEEPEWK